MIDTKKVPEINYDAKKKFYNVTMQTSGKKSTKKLLNLVNLRTMNTFGWPGLGSGISLEFLEPSGHTYT